MPKIHKGSRGGLYYKKRGRKIYISNFGGKSDGTKLRDYFREFFKKEKKI